MGSADFLTFRMYVHNDDALFTNECDPNEVLRFTVSQYLPLHLPSPPSSCCSDDQEQEFKYMINHFCIDECMNGCNIGWNIW